MKSESKSSIGSFQPTRALSEKSERYVKPTSRTRPLGTTIMPMPGLVSPRRETALPDCHSHEILSSHSFSNRSPRLVVFLWIVADAYDTKGAAPHFSLNRLIPG